MIGKSSRLMRIEGRNGATRTAAKLVQRMLMDTRGYLGTLRTQLKTGAEGVRLEVDSTNIGVLTERSSYL